MCTVLLEILDWNEQSTLLLEAYAHTHTHTHTHTHKHTHQTTDTMIYLLLSQKTKFTLSQFIT